MEFSFDVDPNSDVAIGEEIGFDDVDGFDAEVDFDLTGYNPLTPTEAKPGSEDKVKMLAARYSAGVPLWHDSDCYDHGPSTDIQFDENGDEVELIDDLDD